MEENSNLDFKILKKLFIFLIKYIPVIQMAGILLNNILYCFESCDNISSQIDIIFGNSYTTILLFYICSYIFKFCMWHKLIISANLCSLILVNVDMLFKINFQNLTLILLILTIDIIFLFIIIINKFKCKN